MSTYDYETLFLRSDNLFENYFTTRNDRYKITKLPFNLMNQSPLKHKPKRVKSFKPFKKPQKPKQPKKKAAYREGHWTDEEEKLYAEFVRRAEVSQAWGRKQTYSKRVNYFQEMSRFIKTRNPLQCRSHDQKRVLKLQKGQKKVQRKTQRYETSSEEESYSFEETESEQNISEEKTEVKDESECYLTQTTKNEELENESPSKKSQISILSSHEEKKFNFDALGLTIKDPCFQSLPESKTLPPVAQKQLIDLNPGPELKNNVTEIGTMQIEDEYQSMGAEDLQKMHIRMMRRRMLDVVSSLSFTEE